MSVGANGPGNVAFDGSGDAGCCTTDALLGNAGGNVTANGANEVDPT